MKSSMTPALTKTCATMASGVWRGRSAQAIRSAHAVRCVIQQPKRRLESRNLCGDERRRRLRCMMVMVGGGGGGGSDESKVDGGDGHVGAHGWHAAG